MPTKSNKAISAEIYQLKVTLLGTSPAIWRRLLVPADLTLAQLHDVLQIAMGWQECHMHEFSAGGRHFGQPDPEDRFMGMSPVENERTVRLSSVLRRMGAKLIYTYDFGDSWEHSIVLEKRLPAASTVAYPTCVAGQLANLPVPRRIVEVSEVFTICWMLLETRPTSSTKNCTIGSAAITIPKHSPRRL